MVQALAPGGFSFLKQAQSFGESLRAMYRDWFTDDPRDVSQSMALEESHLPRLLKLTIITLSSATALFIAWASITPVKELARTEGQVLPSGYSQLVQHLEGGLVRSILVHEGDFVQKDQVLMELGGAGLEEDFHEQQALVEALALQDERLSALLANRAPDFTAIHASPALTEQQQRMYESMRDSRASERAVLEEQIGQKQSAIARLTQSLSTARSNLSIVKEDKAIASGLMEKGLVARTSYLRKEQDYYSRLGDVNEISKQLDQSRQELSEFQRRREALAAQQRDTTYNELNKVQSDLAQARESLKKRNDRVTRLEVRAPVTGYVKGLRINTIGAVVPAGQTLMEIVPAGEQLIVEARISPQQVGRVAVGQEVQVKIDSYDYVRFGTIPGTLESISAMTFTDEIRRQDYYKGRVKLSKNYAGPAPGSHLILPGMTVDADIVTGEKSVLGYLLKPIQVALRNAMTEQ